MKAAEIVEQMKGLVPDSMDELQYFDPEGNRFVYVSKESSALGDYYRFRIGADIYMFADMVTAYNGANDEALKLFSGQGEGVLSGMIFVDAWRVRGE